MRFLHVILMLFCWALIPVPASAQTASENEDKSFIESWLQDNLSAAGRKIVVTGFKGALSSNATLESLSIADDEGVWFTLKNASLVWSRSALLSGRLDVTEIVAEEIVLARVPQSQESVSTEDSAAWEFALPDLPVSVEIKAIQAGRILLEEPVLGEPANLSLEGSFFLNDGVADGDLKILRNDRSDQFMFKGGFSNASRILALDLDFTEAEGGLVSQLLRIPGAPALGLQLQGEAPLSDYTARLALSSDGVRRFGGTVRISELQVEDEADAGHAFAADLDGDVRPLFDAELHPFMGENAALMIAGQSLADGRLKLETLTLTSGAMAVEGALELSAEGWPDRFNLEARIAGEGATRLPVAGANVTVEAVDLFARYDATAGDEWQARFLLDQLVHGDLRVARAEILGSGIISRGATRSFSSDITFDVEGLQHKNADLARAIGQAPSGTAQLSWTEQSPLQIASLVLQSGDMNLQATGKVDGLTEGFPVAGNATLSSDDFSRFSGLAGRDLAGAAKLNLRGNGALLGGAFDIEVQAETQDLQISEPRLDPLLKGTATLAVMAQRDTTGTTLENLVLKSPAVNANASGQLSPTAGQLDLNAGLTEIALIEPRLNGPARITTKVAWEDGGALSLEDLRLEAVASQLTGSIRLMPEDPGMPVEGDFQLISRDLSRLASLARTPLAGEVTWNFKGKAALRGDDVDFETDLASKGFRSGIPALDQIIAGDVDFETSLALGETAPHVRFLTLETSRLDVEAKSAVPGDPIMLLAQLADVGALVSGFSGPATAEGQIEIEDRHAKRMTVDLSAAGPGGITAQINGAINDYGQGLALDIDGSAPLGLANTFISPISIAGDAQFDLRVDGPAQLSALSGAITAVNGRLTLPRAGFVLDNLQARLSFSEGQATTDITGNAGSGGQFQVNGPVSLNPPYTVSLGIALQQLGVTDPNLFQTTLNGEITVNGPLTGGAGIGGTIALGKTEVQIPSNASITPGGTLDIKHVNTPRDVRITQDRAGLNKQEKGQSGASFPLNLRIQAPNQVFVRGRGLDAELGGNLLLGGTTADVTASGAFELIRGRLDILGRRLLLTEGLIDLRGALDPFLRFVAESTSEEFVVRIILEGLASAPEVRFEAEPDLPQEEAVARLLFGRGLASISPFQAAQLVGAAATLSGRSSGGLVGNLRSSLGLSDLDVTTTEDGTSQVSAGTYINDNIYSEVTVDSEGNQEINLNIDINRNLTVRGGANSTGNTGVGIFFEKDY